MVLMAPADENETRQMLYTGYIHHGPAAVRYPRGTGPGVAIEQAMQALKIGKGELRKQGKGVAILSFGSMLAASLEAGEQLGASVANMRFVKPLDEDLIVDLAERHELLVTIEENAVMWGAGSAVNELLSRLSISVPVLNLGLPDRFVDHAMPKDMLAECGLNKEGIVAAIEQRLKLMAAVKPAIKS